MVLHGFISFTLIWLKDRLYEDLTDRYTLFKDVEVLLDAMTVIVK